MRRYACMKKNSTTQRLHTLTVQINEELCLADEQEEPKDPTNHNIEIVSKNTPVTIPGVFVVALAYSRLSHFLCTDLFTKSSPKRRRDA